MGAKQSKRSVDISGKEAESAGEVAAAGAGGEGRVEPIADADALKPQLNGDAHIQPSQEISDKEKQLDSGTPENEKDATTEKEGKEEQNEEKETTPVTNGDSEPKEDNGETVPTPEEGKKPKKEKVKKKWSLRSISFSRKDKPKQEKKQKEEEPKTNGEPEKVPEEAAEATAELVENKSANVAQADAEVKEEKTPETPVTEPMTNGSSTPESPKVETLGTDDAAAAPAPAAPQEPAKPAAPATEPEQLPLNGLSLEESKEAPEETSAEETKAVEPTVVATETAPAPEIPVRTEVCDAQMPLIEPTPPPLPANPPPSSVASFAATTMAPELIEASLANTADNAILTPPAIPDVTAVKLDENNSDTQTVITNLAVTELSPPLKEIVSEDTPVPATTAETDITQANTESVISNNIAESISYVPEKDDKIESEPEKVQIVSENDTQKKEHVEESIEASVVKTETNELENKIADPVNTTEAAAVGNINGNDSVETPSPVADNINSLQKDSSIDSSTDIDQIPAPAAEFPNAVDDLPPPPPPEDDFRPEDEPIVDNTETVLKENIANDNHIVDTDTNGVIDETEQKNLKNKKVDSHGNIVDVHECNGNGDSAPEVSPPVSPAEPPAAEAGSDASDSLPPPPGELCREPESSSPPPPPQPQPQPLDQDEPHPQDPLPIADKIADLIPEIPSIPELKTETEASLETAVAVAD